MCYPEFLPSIFNHLYSNGRKLSHCLNALNIWTEITPSHKYMSEFSAFVSTHLFFTIFVKGLV